MDASLLQGINETIMTYFGSYNSLFADSLANTFAGVWVWIPLYLILAYMVINNNETMSQIAIIATCMLLCYLFAAFLPDALDNVNCSSKAAWTISVALFFTLLVRNMLLATMLTVWSAVCCWASVYVGNDQPTDVFIGIAWGLVVATITYLLYRKLYFVITPRLNFISTHYTSTGYSFMDIHIALTVVALTCCLAVIKSVITVL